MKTEPRHAVGELDRLRREIAELKSSQVVPFYLRPFRGWVKWAVIFLLIVVLPLAGYAGIQFGLHGERYLFPTASVSCH